MTFVLQSPIVDNGDGTVTATVAGVASGSDTVNIYVASVAGNMTVASFALAATRTGNGTLHWTQAAGYYFAYATDAWGAPTSPVYFSCSDGTQTPHWRVLQAVVSRIATLSLSGIPGANVYTPKQPWDRGNASSFSYPCVLLSYGLNVKETIVQDGNRDVVSADLHGWPVLCTLIRKSNENNVADEAWLHARYQIETAFRNQRLPGVAEIQRCTIEPQAIVVPEMWLKSYDVGGLIIRAWGWESRGLTT